MRIKNLPGKTAHLASTIAKICTPLFDLLHIFFIAYGYEAFLDANNEICLRLPGTFIVKTDIPTGVPPVQQNWSERACSQLRGFYGV